MGTHAATCDRVVLVCDSLTQSITGAISRGACAPKNANPTLTQP